jgi:hypothetical protein
MNEWDHKWGESKSILFNHLGIKEPINALSALIMAIFVYTKMNKNLSVDNILKFFVLINLISSSLAHSTYNKNYITMDGITMLLPLLYISLYYKQYVISIILIYCIINDNITIGFILGILYVLIISQNKISNKNSFNFNVVLLLLAVTLWIIDQKINITERYWFINLHALWHIFATISFINIIDIIQW